MIFAQAPNEVFPRSNASGPMLRKDGVCGLFGDAEELLEKLLHSASPEDSKNISGSRSNSKEASTFGTSKQDNSPIYKHRGRDY